MGQEQRCVATYQGQFSEGKALLETDELLFRGDFRLKIPLPAISSVRAEDGELHVAFGGETAAFVLGRQAARWKERIENPPSLLDKLGIKPGDVVSVVGIDDEPFLAQVQARTGRTIAGSAVAGSDLVFLGAESSPTWRSWMRCATISRPVVASGWLRRKAGSTYARRTCSPPVGQPGS